MVLPGPSRNKPQLYRIHLGFFNIRIPEAKTQNVGCHGNSPANGPGAAFGGVDICENQEKDHFKGICMKAGWSGGGGGALAPPARDNVSYLFLEVGHRGNPRFPEGHEQVLFDKLCANASTWFANPRGLAAYQKHRQSRATCAT